MNELPGWWLGLSAVFFVVNILLFIALIVLIFFVIKFVKELTPMLQRVTTQVEALSQRVHGIAGKVEEIADNTKTTLDAVGGRAKSVSSSVDLIANSASRQFEKFAPFIVGATTAIRLVRSLAEIRKGAKPKEATTKKALEGRRKA